MSTKTPLASLIRAAALDERLVGPPPTSEELSAYVAGVLPDDQLERIRDYVAFHPASRKVVAALQAVPPGEPPNEDYRVSDEQIDEGWRAMAAELGIPDAVRETPAEERPAPAPARKEKASLWTRLWSIRMPVLATAPALAAALVVGIVGKSALDRETPWLNVRVVDLKPKSHVERSAPGPEDTLRPSDRAEVWNLLLTDFTEYSFYEVEILGDDEVVWTGRTGQLTEAGYLNVHLPPRYFDPGTYLVKLYGITGAERKLLEEYVARIAP